MAEKLSAEILSSVASEVADSKASDQVDLSPEQQDATQEATQESLSEIPEVSQLEPDISEVAPPQDQQQETPASLKAVEPADELKPVSEEAVEDADSTAKGAYRQLKELLVPEGQPDQPHATAEEQAQPTQSTTEVEQPEPAAVEEAVDRQPRTAAEILAEAAKIADNEDLYLRHTSRMLIIRGLVERQERLHDNLSTIRRQFTDIEYEIKSLRNERFLYHPVEKKKHKWSKLLRW